MSESEVVQRIANEIRVRFEGESSGHDWWHIYRVWKMARRLGEEEGANLFIVELAALLHDIADWKFHDGDDTLGPILAREFMLEHGISEEVTAQVCDIIATLSFKGAGVPTEMRTLEGKVVQDADRLDAIGAVGIARTFAYGGHKNRPMHEPSQKPVLHQTKEEYMRSTSSTINHFHEKLLLLKGRMNTDAARNIAEGRHRFMEQYLEQFFEEWEGLS